VLVFSSCYHPGPNIGNLTIVGEVVVKLFIKFAGCEISQEVYGNSLFGWEMYKAVTAALMTDLQKKAKLGAEAPNPCVVSADGHLICLCREALKIEA